MSVRRPITSTEATLSRKEVRAMYQTAKIRPNPDATIERCMKCRDEILQHLDHHPNSLPKVDWRYLAITYLIDNIYSEAIISELIHEHGVKLDDIADLNTLQEFVIQKMTKNKIIYIDSKTLPPELRVQIETIAKQPPKKEKTTP